MPTSAQRLPGGGVEGVDPPRHTQREDLTGAVRRTHVERPGLVVLVVDAPIFHDGLPEGLAGGRVHAQHDVVRGLEDLLVGLKFQHEKSVYTFG